ncbi:hypothetical protein ACFX2G_038532 [Malus domestica]
MEFEDGAGELWVGDSRFCRCSRRAGGHSAILAEAEAIRATFVFCKNEGFTKVEIESDAQVLLQMINKEIEVNADLECLLFDIDSLVKHIEDVKIGFVPQGSNLAAHTVASFTAKYGGPFVWDEIGLEFLFNILAMDVNISIRL